jgi:hypothetical protein
MERERDDDVNGNPDCTLGDMNRALFALQEENKALRTQLRDALPLLWEAHDQSTDGFQRGELAVVIRRIGSLGVACE